VKGDALDLLVREHQAMESCFGAGHDAECCCTELTILLRLEHEIVIPLAREILGDDPAVDEFEASHEGVRDMVAQVLATHGDDPLHAARFAVLRDYAGRHLQNQRERLIPLLRAAGADTGRAAKLFATRKDELRAVTEALRESLLTE
jgi:hypothetical protein